ncbi:penicillin acylase family protein [Nocardiopsis sp. CNT-189]|uniref:penicillin acylase family protein n=1 Tax=Nocardiopsis oceanisediminis TaxID=2816862 RepID=UPI003B2EA16D
MAPTAAPLRRRLAAAAACAALLAPAAAATGVHRPEPSAYPLPGLEEAAEIRVDRWGVPHIYAESTGDLYFAQGVNAARDRLFQIDLERRRGLGLLSEAFGPAFTEQDRAARLFLYRGDMEAEWAAYGERTRLAARRFADGVNAYIDWLEENPGHLPAEFAELGHRPGRWRAEDVVRIRSSALTGNVVSEVVRARTACAAGVRADALRAPLRPDAGPEVPDGLDPCAIPPGVLDDYLLATAPADLTRPSPPAHPPSAAEGSNAWAVAPERTGTGRPLLAGDPHRALTAPSTRYFAHLSAPGTDVAGAGDPGAPGVAMGHNGTAAFGLTYFSADAEDLYVYRLHPDDPGLYAYRGGWERMRRTTERIPVRGGDPVEVELLFTRHGPVVLADGAGRAAYAVRTAWSEPGTAPYLGSLELMRARGAEAFGAALSEWGGPPLTYLYADASGSIALAAGGRVPVREGFDGLLPVPGDGRYEWSGFAPGSELPAERDPAAGFLASANEYRPGPGAPAGYEWPPPLRHQRITEALAADPAFGPGDAMTLQNDRYDPVSGLLLPFLEGLGPHGRGDGAGAGAALAVLEAWDGSAAEDSAGAALFRIWASRHLAPAVREAALPPSPLPDPGADPEALAAALRALDPGDRDALLTATLAGAYAEAEWLLGPDPARWRWGGLQQTWFAHAAGAHLGPFPRGGAPHSVDATGHGPADFTHHTGASARMVLDVGAWDASRAVNAPGQSGDPSSPHYADLLPMWRRGDYFPLLYTRAAVVEHTERTIRLLPAP